MSKLAQGRPIDDKAIAFDIVLENYSAHFLKRSITIRRSSLLHAWEGVCLIDKLPPIFISYIPKFQLPFNK